MTFLATTALKSHWADGDVMLLGPWCAPFHELDGNRYSLLGELCDPLESAADLLAARQYVDACYEAVLGELSEGLSEIHGVSQSTRYWRIICGPWLHVYISVLYERYISLKSAVKVLPEFTTLVCEGNEYPAPHDNYEFYYWVCSDEYNLYLYSRVLECLGLKFEQRPIGNKQLIGYDPRRSSGKEIIKKIYSMVISIQQLFARGNKPKVVLEDTYLGPKLEWKLKALLGNSCVISYQPNVKISHKEVRYDMRRELAEKLSGNCEFRQILKKLIPADFPVTAIEGFAELRKLALKNVPPPGSLIVSSGGWNHNELLKHYSAMAADQGSKLIAIQHGGTYGFLDFVPHYLHEKEISDVFLTWGWGEGDHARVRPFISSKLSRVERTPSRDHGEGVLYVCTAEARYSSNLQYRPQQFIRYFMWQSRFLQALPSGMHGDLVVRLYPVDFGWGYERRWKKWSANFRLDKSGHTFIESVFGARMVVVDALTTTWLEVLSANVPLVIYFDPSSYSLRPEAQSAIDLMEEVGIVHLLPESAAEFVNKTYARVEEWWGSCRVQEVRQRICSQFARSASNPLEIYFSFFKENLSRDI